MVIMKYKIIKKLIMIYNGFRHGHAQVHEYAVIRELSSVMSTGKKAGRYAVCCVTGYMSKTSWLGVSWRCWLVLAGCWLGVG